MVARKNRWRMTPLLGFPPSFSIEAANWTLGRIVELGLVAPSSNRLWAARRLIENLNERSTPLDSADEDLLARLTDAQRTIWEQYIIVRSCGKPPKQLSSLHKSKLGEMLSGAGTEAADRNPLARSTQFELLVAAFFAMGDAKVGFASADLCLSLPGEDVVIAVKRLNRAGKLKVRVKEAVAQIERDGRRGLIALNLDVYARHIHLDVDEENRGSQFQAEVSDLEPIIELLKNRTSVLGVANFGTVTTWSFTKDLPRFEMNWFRQIRLTRNSHDEDMRFTPFFHRMWRKIEDRMTTLGQSS
jgi:hypothetical protein